MKVIIAGSRTINDYDILEKAIKRSLFNITEIVSGGARGIDTLAIEYAKNNNIKYVIFPANWVLHGKKAGYLRNIEMSVYSDGLIAIWDCISKGTSHMIDISIKKHLEIFIYQH